MTRADCAPEGLRGETLRQRRESAAAGRAEGRSRAAKARNMGRQTLGFDDPLAALGTLRMRLRRETFLSDVAVKYDAATRREAMLAPIDDPD